MTLAQIEGHPAFRQGYQDAIAGLPWAKESYEYVDSTFYEYGRHMATAGHRIHAAREPGRALWNAITARDVCCWEIVTPCPNMHRWARKDIANRLGGSAGQQESLFD